MRTWLLLLAASMLLLAPVAVRAQESKPGAPPARLLKPMPLQVPNLQVAQDKNAPAPQKSSGPAPRIVCDAPQYDFGSVAEGEEVKHVFTVRNAGKGALKILQARGG